MHAVDPRLQKQVLPARRFPVDPDFCATTPIARRTSFGGRRTRPPTPRRSSVATTSSRSSRWSTCLPRCRPSNPKTVPGPDCERHAVECADVASVRLDKVERFDRCVIVDACGHHHSLLRRALAVVRRTRYDLLVMGKQHSKIRLSNEAREALLAEVGLEVRMPERAGSLRRRRLLTARHQQKRRAVPRHRRPARPCQCRRACPGERAVDGRDRPSSIGSSASAMSVVFATRRTVAASSSS